MMENIKSINAEEMKMTNNVVRDFFKTSLISIMSQIASMDNTVKNNTRATRIMDTPFLNGLFMIYRISLQKLSTKAIQKYSIFNRGTNYSVENPVFLYFC